MAVTTVWRANAVSQLHWQQWQAQDFILFNAASGQTHFLNAVGAEALRRLQQSALSSTDLCQQLSELFEFESSIDLQNYLENMLNAMDDFGLIESCEQ